MSIFEKSRFEIWNQLQHPYKHTLSDFAYSHNSTPWVTTLEGALNAIMANLYPNTKGQVADVAALLALPAVDNVINDYRVVVDDGDGRGAGYRWEQREGEAAASWHKIYDMDWGEDSILSNFLTKTNDTYVSKKGQDDIDANGDLLTGINAGQYIYGGQSADTHLTLYANSGDGLNANTGFVQFGDNLRPITDDSLGLGTPTERFKDGYLSGLLKLKNILIDGDVITSSTGSIDFSDENISTSGVIESSSNLVQTFTTMGYIATPANPVADYSSLYFKADGKLYSLNDSGVEKLIGLTFTSTNDNRLIKSDGTSGSAIQESGITVSDTNEIAGATRVSVGNLDLTANSLTSSDVDGDINLTPNGNGSVVVPNLKFAAPSNNSLYRGDVNGELVPATAAVLSDGDVLSGIAELYAAQFRLTNGFIYSTFNNGSITLQPNGTGEVRVTSSISPFSDNAYDLGGASAFKDLYLKGSIKSASLEITIATLMSFRDALVNADTGHTLFYNAVTQKWGASAPDSEIDHGTLAGITDDDHTQYVKNTGRGDSQTIQGGANANGNLILESTSDVSKGTIQFSDTVHPVVDASYSGGWSGNDVGASAKRIRNVYSAGEFVGFRLENTTTATLPASSANNIGRGLFNTTTNELLIDNGSTLQAIGGSKKFISDQSFNGTDLTKDVTVSGVSDARNCIIQLLDSSNDYERIYCSIKAISATVVRITTGTALPSGSYRLIVIE